jgi:hypothetical protein
MNEELLVLVREMSENVGSIKVYLLILTSLVIGMFFTR